MFYARIPKKEYYIIVENKDTNESYRSYWDENFFFKDSEKDRLFNQYDEYELELVQKHFETLVLELNSNYKVSILRLEKAGVNIISKVYQQASGSKKD